MLELIAWMVVVFGLLTAWYAARTDFGRFVAGLTAVVFGTMIYLQGAAARDALAAARREVDYQATIARTDALLGNIRADKARLEELCSRYPSLKGC